MEEPKGFKLYVNLGASQVRRRLRGFGHGVRKVQSAGRNQALVIHTATGRHCEELQSLFADVGSAGSLDDMEQPIENLANLGPRSGRWLREVGIRTIGDLERLGPVLAYRLVKQQEPRATLSLLWALAAGLRDLDWRELPEATKRHLEAQLEQT